MLLHLVKCCLGYTLGDFLTKASARPTRDTFFNSKLSNSTLHNLTKGVAFLYIANKPQNISGYKEKGNLQLKHCGGSKLFELK
jgi:hypothetical protein